MALADGPCEVTGLPGILDEIAAYRCACCSPFMAVFCDGTMKDSALWKDWRGGSVDDLPERPPGKRTFKEMLDSELAS